MDDEGSGTLSRRRREVFLRFLIWNLKNEEFCPTSLSWYSGVHIGRNWVFSALLQTTDMCRGRWLGTAFSLIVGRNMRIRSHVWYRWCCVGTFYVARGDFTPRGSCWSSVSELWWSCRVIAKHTGYWRLWIDGEVKWALVSSDLDLKSWEMDCWALPKYLHWITSNSPGVMLEFLFRLSEV